MVLDRHAPHGGRWLPENELKNGWDGEVVDYLRVFTIGSESRAHGLVFPD